MSTEIALEIESSGQGRRTNIDRYSWTWCFLCCCKACCTVGECFSKGGEKIADGAEYLYQGIGFVYLIAPLCCAIWTLLGLSVASIRVVEHFYNMYTQGYEYFESDLQKIATATGALATAMATFYKLHLLKLAYRYTYTKKKHFILGYGTLIIIYLLLVFYTTYCTTTLYFWFCFGSAIGIIIIAYIFARIKYSGIEKITIIMNSDDKIDKTLKECNGRRFLELFTMLFAAISFAVGTGVIIVSLTEMKEIFSWSTDCRNYDSTIYDESPGKTILDDLIAGVFVTASAMGKLADTKFRQRNIKFKICFVIFLIFPLISFIIIFGSGDSQFHNFASIFLMIILGLVIITGLGTILYHDDLE